MIYPLKTRVPRILAALAIAFLGAVNLSMTYLEPAEILLQEDLQLEDEFSNHPVLHTVDNEMQSFLKWYCFSSQEITRVACLDEEGNDPKTDEEGNDWGNYDPIVILKSDRQTSYFEMGYMLNAESCLEKIETFKRLIKGQSAFCMYAAQWPPHDIFESAPSSEPLDYFVAYGFRTPLGRYLAPVFDPDSADFIDKK